MNASLKYELSNKTEHDVVLILEPWAEEFTIASNSVISIKIIYTKMGAIESELNPKYFILWLWGGCRAEVLLNGRNLTPASLAIPAFG